MSEDELEALSSEAPSASHPAGLYILAATEFCARFAWFGMLGLFSLFLILQLLPGQADVPGLAALRGLFEPEGPIDDEAFAMAVFGWLTGLVLFLPILGGLLADLWLGTRATTVVGALLLVAGYVAVLFEAGFLAALALFVLGMACFKGGIVPQVGQLYPREAESLRTQAYVIVSGIINVGAAAGTWACAQIAVSHGWQAGFGAAGGAMLLALIVYLAGQRHLPGDRPARDEDDIPPPDDQQWSRRIGLIFLVGAILILPATASTLILNLGIVWVAGHVDLSTGPGETMAIWLGMTDAIAAILAVPVLVLLWRWQARRRREPGDLAKLGIGSAMFGASALFLVAGSLLAGPDGRVSILWPFACFLGTGIATLYCWPVLLALVSRAAPQKLNATMVALAVLPLYLGSLVARWIGGFYRDMDPALFWATAAAIGLAGGLIILLIGRTLARGLAAGGAAEK